MQGKKRKRGRDSPKIRFGISVPNFWAAAAAGNCDSVIFNPFWNVRQLHAISANDWMIDKTRSGDARPTKYRERAKGRRARVGKCKFSIFHKFGLRFCFFSPFPSLLFRFSLRSGGWHTNVVVGGCCCNRTSNTFPYTQRAREGERERASEKANPEKKASEGGKISRKSITIQFGIKN